MIIGQIDTNLKQKLVRFFVPVKLNDHGKKYFEKQYLQHAATSVKYAMGSICIIIYFEFLADHQALFTIAVWGAVVLLLQVARYVFATRALHLSRSIYKRCFYIVETLAGIGWAVLIMVMNWQESNEFMAYWRGMIIFIIFVFYLDTMRFSMLSLFVFPIMISIATCAVSLLTIDSSVLQNRTVLLSMFGTATLILYGRSNYLFCYATYKLIEENEKLLSEMNELLIHDELTQQHNRRYFTSKLTQYIALFHRSQQHFSLAILDIDYFKNINDNYGHPVGDVILIELSAFIKNRLRRSDILARYGGEEFVILLPITEITQSIEILDEIRVDIEAKVFQVNNHQIKTTVSIGVTMVQHNDDAEKLLARSDEALYRAKAYGRNRVTSA